MLVVIRGAGDLASGIALRLFRSKMKVVMTDIAIPTSIRRTVSFSEAIRDGHTSVEEVRAQFAESAEQALSIVKKNQIAVIIDPDATCINELKPDVVVDAILAKANLGTTLSDAPVVIGVGPGFTASTDCHAVIETMRGHYLGRAIYSGGSLPNTNIPGLIGGFTGERVLRAPADGLFTASHVIGDTVKTGDIAGTVDNVPMLCTIDGTLRGILADGVIVKKGMKSGDIDPRCERAHCFSVSDKALAVGGGVLEAILNLSSIIGGANHE